MDNFLYCKIQARMAYDNIKLSGNDLFIPMCVIVWSMGTEAGDAGGTLMFSLDQWLTGT